MSVSDKQAQQRTGQASDERSLPAEKLASGKVIGRGLATKREGRCPSLESPLEDLGNNPDELPRQKSLSRYRLLLVTSMVVLTVLLPMGFWYGLQVRAYRLCNHANGEFDDIWGQKTKAAIRLALMDTATSFALESWERVEKNLGSYLAEWKQMNRQLCEANILRGTLSEDRFRQRRGCLRQRQAEFGALARVLAKADGAMIPNAVQASLSLTRIDLCAADDLLRASYPPPKAAALAAKVKAAEETLAEIHAWVVMGAYRRGLQLYRTSQVEMSQINYLPVKAKMLYQLGSLHYQNGDYDQAELALQQAVHYLAKTGNRLLAAETMARLVMLVGYDQRRPKDGLLMGRYTEILIALDSVDATIRAQLSNNLGVVLWSTAQHEKALGYLRQALAIRKTVLGPIHPQVATTLNNMGAVFQSMGRFDVANDYYVRSLTVTKHALGSNHPDVARVINKMDEVLHDKEGSKNTIASFEQESALISE